MPYLVEVYDDHVIFELGNRLFSITYRMEGTVAVLTGDPAEVQRAFVPVEGGATMKLIMKSLGLAENATEAEAVVALNARDTKGAAAAAPVGELLALTGKATASEALGVVQGWKLGAEQTAALSARVATLEAEQTEREVAAVVAELLSAGKLTPAQKEFALKLGRTDFAQLKAFAEVAVKVVPFGAAHREPGRAPGVADMGDRKWEALSGKQKAALKSEASDLYAALRAERRTGKTLPAAK